MVIFLPVASAVLIIFATISTVSAEVLLPKCCAIDGRTIERDSKLECTANTKQRLQIFSENYNFLSGNSDGECIDSDEIDFYVYKIEEFRIISKTTINETYYPKCCPLRMKYDLENHSCVESLNPTEDWINGTFIKVGLPNCKLILDKKLSKASDFFDSILDEDESSYCIDQDTQNNFVIRQCEKDLSVCETKRCLRKCCPDGQSFVGGGKCVDTHVHGFSIQNKSFTNYIENPKDDYEIIYSTACPAVTMIRGNKISYSITKDGVWKYYRNYSKSFIEETYDHPRSYCIEHAQKGNLSDYIVFECINKSTAPAAKFGWTFWSKILSCIALLATVIIYIVMGEIKNPFGKILINYCAAMFFLMIILLVAHKQLVLQRTECKIRGYFIILFNTALYAWLNIMSLDIWWTFGSPKRSIGRDQRSKEIRKMLLYALYGWGLPVCHALVILIFDINHVLPEAIQPYVGIYYCYLEARNYARHVFILMPLLVIHVINTVLFIKTATYCIKVKNEINKMNDSSRGKKERTKFMQNKDRLGLIIKLAVIMGVIYIFELISSFFDMKNTKWQLLEVVMDNITCLQGVFIFVIFICKRKTLDFVKNRRYLIKERRTSTSTSFTSQLHNNASLGSIHTDNKASIHLK